MTPYLILLSFIMLWIILEKKSVNRTSFWLPLLGMSLFAGIRSSRVGTDSGNYTKFFRDNLPIHNYSFNENVEYGYQLFQYILLYFTHNYFWLFFLTAFFIVFIFLRTIKYYSLDYTMSVYLFITLGSYTFFFNILRQGIAISISLLAIPYLLEKKLFKFICVVSLASLFHISALTLLPFYFIVNVNIKLIYKIIINYLSSFIGSSFIIFYLASTNPRYSTYTKNYEEGNGFFTVAFYGSLVVIIYLIGILYKIKDDFFWKLFTLYATGIALTVPLVFLGTNPSGPLRLLYFFTWTLIFLIPIILKRINNIFITLLAVLISLIYFILTTSTFANLIPYTVNPLFKIV